MKTFKCLKHGIIYKPRVEDGIVMGFEVCELCNKEIDEQLLIFGYTNYQYVFEMVEYNPESE